jgi:4-azaleucine resistance transporter AzlC
MSGPAQGFRDAGPLVVAYLAIAAVYGVMAHESGWPLAVIGLMSALVYSGATQFAVVGLLAGQGGWSAALATGGLLTLRHLILAGSLAPHLGHLKPWQRAVAAFGLTDEAYGLAIGPAQAGRLSRGYLAGVMGSLYLAWIAGSLLGGALGSAVPDPARYGLDFVFPACFIGLVVPGLRKGEEWATALAWAGLAWLLAGVLPGSGFLLAAGLLGPLAGLAVRRIPRRISA